MIEKRTDFWALSEQEQKVLLGEDVGISQPCFVVELDPHSQRRFYNKPYVPLGFWIEPNPNGGQEFHVCVESVDDSVLHMIWQTGEMEATPATAMAQIENWLARTNYFINLKGFEDVCLIFGSRLKVEYN